MRGQSLSVAAITGGSIGTGTTGVVTVLAQSGAAVSSTNTTGEETLATITVPAGTLRANDSLRIRFGFTYQNNANVKTLKAHYSGVGGTAVLSVGRATQINSDCEIIIQNANSTSAQTCRAREMNAGASFAIQVNATAVDTTASTTFVITSTKATGTDTLTLDYYTAEVIKA